MWARVLADVVRVTSEWDREWMQRRRLLNTLLVVLFVFRLVLAPRNQGYAATATELWDQCRQLDIPLPQSAPVSPGEVAVYDRGYYSFGLLHTHCARGVQAVFRLKKNANGPLRAFIRSVLSADQIVVEPSATTRAQLPDTLLRPCRVRLVKYTAGASSCALATTLLDARAYPARALADLYHGRWSIEELYKISKQMLTVEYFHSRSERGVKQELFAHFTLIAMTRLFTNHTEGGFRSEAGKPPMQANFQNAMRTMARNVAGLLLQYSTTLCQTVGSMLASASVPAAPIRGNRASPPANGSPPTSPPRPSKPHMQPDAS